MFELPDRYWAKVKKTEGCWLWTGAKNPHGYGKLRVAGRYIDAHRLSYAAHYDEPGNQQVLHRCDTPSCVRPDHLFLGSQADNIRDKVEKDRQLRGERIRQSKLRGSDIPLIFRMRQQGMTYAAIGKVFGVGHVTIYNVIKGTTWKDQR